MVSCAEPGRPVRAGVRQAGFTLLELLVTLVVFAIFSLLAMGGLNNFLIQQNLINEQLQQLDRLQRLMRLVVNDISQAQPRCVRDEMGLSREGSFVADGRDDYLLRLTRGGWRNPVGLQRGTLQRVQYRLEEERFIREYWPVLDRVLGQEPRSEELMDGLLEVNFSFLDDSDEWQSLWPPLRAADTDQCEQRPRAVRITFEFDGLGEIERLIEIPR